MIHPCAHTGLSMPQSYLIIIYSYKPALSARAFRWAALAEHWASQGHHIDVIAAWQPGLLAHENLDGVHVHRVNSILLTLLLNRAPASITIAPPDGPQRPGPLFHLALRWLRAVWRMFYWPDAAVLWYGPALRKARALMRQHRYDALITVSPFFTSHLVGEHLSADWWLADYGDPFSFQDIEPHNNWKLYRRLNRAVERRIFRRVNAISVTTEPTRDIYAAQFPESAAKINVIPPLLSIPPLPESAPPIDERIRLLFAGMLYPNTRRPDRLLKLFAGLMQRPDLAQRLELHFIGETNLVTDAFAPYQRLIDQGHIILHGVLPREQVHEHTQRASILVNIGNRTPYQLPSKVIEYAATGKPVLNLAQIDNDSSSSVLSTYPAALNLFISGDTSFDQQLQALTGWIDHLPPPVDPDYLHQWLARFQLDEIVAAYDRLLAK
jgi:glycosyltransferase involved in cell wall biosynthesis